MGALTYGHLFCFLVAHLLLPGTQSECTNGWMKYNTYCYGVISSPQSWMGAEIECQTRYHGHLASLISETEHEAVANYLRNSFPAVRSIWVGLHDPRNTRNWEWIDLAPYFYNSWSPGEPDNKGNKEYCVHMCKKTGFTKWYDANCQLKLVSLCKTKL